MPQQGNQHRQRHVLSSHALAACLSWQVWGQEVVYLPICARELKHHCSPAEIACLITAARLCPFTSFHAIRYIMQPIQYRCQMQMTFCKPLELLLPCLRVCYLPFPSTHHIKYGNLAASVLFISLFSSIESLILTSVRSCRSNVGDSTQSSKHVLRTGGTKDAKCRRWLWRWMKSRPLLLQHQTSHSRRTSSQPWKRSCARQVRIHCCCNPHELAPPPYKRRRDASWQGNAQACPAACEQQADYPCRRAEPGQG